MTTEKRKTPRQLHAESMVYLKDTSGWKLLYDHFVELQVARLKIIMDPTTDDTTMKREIIEYAATKKILDWPDQHINEKDLNDGR